MPEKDITEKKDTTEETDISTDEIVKPMGETPKVFESIKRDERRLINILEVNTLRNATDKTDYGLLSAADKIDLTDSGETTLHSHAFIVHAVSDHTSAESSINMDGQTLINLQDPTGQADHWAATKGYVDIGSGQFAAGELLFSSADTTNAISDTSYTKTKEITIYKGGTLRIRFRITYGSSAGAYIRAQVYKNGSPVADTERERTTGSATFTVNVADWSPGDEVQLYAFKEQNIGGDTATVAEFRIYVDKFDGSLVVLD